MRRTPRVRPPVAHGIVWILAGLALNACGEEPAESGSREVAEVEPTSGKLRGEEPAPALDKSAPDSSSRSDDAAFDALRAYAALVSDCAQRDGSWEQFVKLLNEFDGHANALERCGDELRSELTLDLIQVLCQKLDPLRQPTTQHVVLKLAETAWAAGDLALADSVLWFFWGALRAVDRSDLFAWATSLRSRSRAIDVRATAGDLAGALEALREGRELLEVARLWREEHEVEPSASECARAADLHVSAADLFRVLGRLEDAASEIGLAYDWSERGEVGARLAERIAMSDLDLLLQSGDLRTAIARCNEYLERGRASGSASADLAALLMRRAFAEFGVARDAGGSLSVVRSTLEEILDRKGVYPDTLRRCWTKYLEVALWDDDLPLAKRCIERGDELFHGKLDMRRAEFEVFRSEYKRRTVEPGTGSLSAALLPSVEELAEQWASQPLRRGGLGFLESAWRRMILSEYIACLLHDGGDVESALEMLIGLQQHTTLARATGAEACSLELVRKWLLPGFRDRLLVYLPSRFRTHVFVVGPTQALHIELAPEGEYASEIQNLRSSLLRSQQPDQRAPVERIRSLAKSLRDVLFPDEVSRELAPGCGVAIIGADLLLGIPFEVLPVNGDGLLGEYAAISYLDSLPFGVHRAARSADLARAVHLTACTASSKVADPRPFQDAWWEPLVGAASRGLVLDKEKGENATVARVLDGLSQAVGVLHVVGHGVRRWDHELSSGIALADGALWPEALDGRSYEGVVLLSACSAGRGEMRRGDGSLLTNLGGAALWSGARAVVLPLCPVPVEDHLEFMGRVYAALRDGASTAEAVRLARVASAADGSVAARLRRCLVQVHGVGQQPPWN